MTIDKDMKKRFDEWCEVNIKILKEKGDFSATAMVIDKNNEASMLMLIFRNYEEKRAMQDMLKKFVVSHDTKCYFFASDSIMTIMDNKT